jgi:hypothetical protein
MMMDLVKIRKLEKIKLLYIKTMSSHRESLDAINNNVLGLFNIFFGYMKKLKYLR